MSYLSNPYLTHPLSSSSQRILTPTFLRFFPFRLLAIADAEKAKARREEAYNMLEGYLYRIRDLLNGDSGTPFKEFAQPHEQKKLTEGLAETLAWLHDDSDNATADELWAKRNTLE